VSEPAPGTVFVVCGPTASGKSALALAIAQRIGGGIINADSMQVYRGLEILSAQPTAEERALVPHFLYGVLEPDDPCSAGRWRELALKAIADVRAAGRVPVLCGGTGLYLRALMQGIAPVPMIPADVRAAVRARHAALGNAAFHAELAARDPETAAGIRPSDPLRMMRAMEVLEATGLPLARWRALPGEGAPDGTIFRTVLLDPPRDALYAAIEARFRRMVTAGALAEAAALVARGVDPQLPAMKALGVAELARAAAGEVEIEYAVMRAVTQSRNYAKRQVTWFRRQLIADFTYKEKFSESLYKKILSEIL
jgi:tRNA dimethylallyltransferase